MRARRALLFAATAGAIAGGVVWWRRRHAVSAPAAQIGLADGSIHTLGAADPAASELESLATAARAALEAGG